MAAIAMKDLLEAGVHFGHQTKRWNPKMKEVHLRRTERHLHHRPGQDGEAVPGGRGVRHAARGRGRHDPVRRHQAPGAGRDRRGGAALRDVLREPALARRPAHQLHHDPAQPRPPARSRGDGHRRPLRIALQEGDRADREGEAQAPEEPRRHPPMSRLPDAIFVVDTHKEKIAVDEARKLKIPVIGIVDTNCDPDEVDLRDPGQRRRPARDPAVRVADGRRDHRRPRHARGDRTPRPRRPTRPPTRSAAGAASGAPAPSTRPARRLPPSGPPFRRFHPAGRALRAGVFSVRAARSRGARETHRWQSRQNRSRRSASRPARA